MSFNTSLGVEKVFQANHYPLFLPLCSFNRKHLNSFLTNFFPKIIVLTCKLKGDRLDICIQHINALDNILFLVIISNHSVIKNSIYFSNDSIIMFLVWKQSIVSLPSENSSQVKLKENKVWI